MEDKRNCSNCKKQLEEGYFVFKKDKLCSIECLIEWRGKEE